MSFKVISFDGISGTGKSTLMRWAMGYFAQQNKVAGISENLLDPWREELAARIKDIRASNCDKKNEDRVFVEYAVRGRQFITETFVQLLKTQAKTELLFLDRWTATCMAYQSLNGLEPVEIFEKHNQAGIIQPDLQVILTCPVDMAVDRVDRRTTKHGRGVSGKMSTVRKKDGTVVLIASHKKKQRIQSRFLEFSDFSGQGKVLVVDTAGAVEDIAAKVISGISKSLGNVIITKSAVRQKIEDGEFFPAPYDNMVLSG